MMQAPKSECPAVTGQIATLISNNTQMYATPDNESKAAPTLTAQLALRGCAVHATFAEDRLVYKHFLTHCADDLQALRGFARRAGVRDD